MVDLKTHRNVLERIRPLLPDVGESATLIGTLPVDTGDERPWHRTLQAGTVVTIREYPSDMAYVVLEFRGDMDAWWTTTPMRLHEALGTNWREHHQYMQAINNPNQQKLNLSAAPGVQ